MQNLGGKQSVLWGIENNLYNIRIIWPAPVRFYLERCLIDYFSIAHNTLCLPPKFCITYCLKMLFGKCNTLRST